MSTADGGKIKTSLNSSKQNRNLTSKFLLTGTECLFQVVIRVKISACTQSKSCQVSPAVPTIERDPLVSYTVAQ